MLALGAGLVLAFGCSRGERDERASGGRRDPVVVRVTGSDTMVNLVQAWAENYRQARPGVSVRVAGGGSDVGIAGLIDGIVDIAASSRAMESEEVARARRHNGTEPQEFRVGLDGLAVYVHRDNPVETISMEELAGTYGESGTLAKWSQLGITNSACASDEIVRVGRENGTGTYDYFREAVLGRQGDFKMGSIEQSGSRDVVTLISRTPCAIGYSGMAYATADVKALNVSARRGESGVAPTETSTFDGSYPLSRPLYLYTRQTPAGEVKAFLDWVLSEAGQKIVSQIGYVPVASSGSSGRLGDPEAASRPGIPRNSLYAKLGELPSRF